MVGLFRERKPVHYLAYSLFVSATDVHIYITESHISYSTHQRIQCLFLHSNSDLNRQCPGSFFTELNAQLNPELIGTYK